MMGNNENIVCPYCSGAVEKTGVDISELSPNYHRGTTTREMNCNNCGYKKVDKGHGCLRSSSTEPLTVKEYEYIPEGYMAVIEESENKVLASVELTTEQLDGAIEKCAEKGEEDWYAIDGGNRFEVANNRVQEDIESLAFARISAKEGEVYGLNN